MKTTILYLHDSTAFWMLWQGRRLLQVFNEPVTRSMAEHVAASSTADGIQSLCPWLTTRSPKVRLVIDPVMDKTQIIPAFDLGLKEPKGMLACFRRHAWHVYLTCRSLTSDVLIDDLTRYRREQLSQFPTAMLQWYASSAMARNGTQSYTHPCAWLLTDSGVPDYVFTWLHAMTEQGLEYTDARPVSALFAKEDAKHQTSVITVWVESNRWRLIMTAHGYVVKVEQWASEIEARIALDDAIKARQEEGVCPKVFFLGSAEDRVTWAQSLEAMELDSRDDEVGLLAEIASSSTDALPKGCTCLPLQALLQSNSRAKIGRWSETVKQDFGSTIRVLLSSARWKRRYKQSIIATTVAAAFAGYFALLAVMHALDVIELHDRADEELSGLARRLQTLEASALALHPNPHEAVAAIYKLDEHANAVSANRQNFLKYLAKLLQDQTSITLRSVSWRDLPKLGLADDEAAWLSSVSELREPANSLHPPENNERLVFLSGNVAFNQNRQQATDSLMTFLNALSAEPAVLDVIPMTDALSSTQSMNFPSDVIVEKDDPTAFVIAVRFSV